MEDREKLKSILFEVLENNKKTAIPGDFHGIAEIAEVLRKIMES